MSQATEDPDFQDQMEYDAAINEIEYLNLEEIYVR